MQEMDTGLIALSLKNFRSFNKSQSFIFPKQLIVIYGANAVGKTNLLEAIYFINTGKGFRERKVEELISHQNNDLSVTAKINEEKIEHSLSLVLKKKIDVTQKAFLVNGLKKTYKEYRTRVLPIILFEPNDLDIINGNPEKRRAFIDEILVRTNWQYYVIKNEYDRALYKRNKILTNGYSRQDELLCFWDKYLEEKASLIQNYRENMVLFFNNHPEFNKTFFLIKYLPNVFSIEHSKELREQELKIGRTLSGPQLDDYLISKEEKGYSKKLGNFGSRSEQRLAVLWLKVNELIYLKEKLKRNPILLLDDIFSEFDNDNIHKIIDLFSDYQTFITTTNKDFFEGYKKDIYFIEIS